MVALFSFILISYGMTNIIVNGSIFENTREWIGTKSQFLYDLLSCEMCTGFWVGMGLFWLTDFNFFLAGCMASGSCWIIKKIIK